MLLSTFLLALLPAAFARPAGESRRSRAVEHSGAGHQDHALEKRQSFSGRATFYDVGLGACGGYNVASDFIVALNAPQYGGGYPGPHCGETITISYGGKTAQATIRDLCPGCGHGDLDLSRGLFNYFADESMGVFQMSWTFGGGGGGQQQAAPEPEPEPEPEPTSTWTPPPPTSETPPPPPSSTWSPTPESSQPTSTTPTPASSTQPTISASASVDPFNVLFNSTESVTISGSVVAAPIVTAPAIGMGNLALLNQAVTNYGAVIVVAGSST